MAGKPSKLELEAAILAWWDGCRPFDWAEREHIENPTVNCTGAEKQLALLAAALRAPVVTRKD